MLLNISLILIVLTGILTSTTDILHRQIKNHYLIIMAGLGFYAYLSDFIVQKSIPTLQLLSLGAAIVIGLLLYSQNLWRGGDAKLFILFAFLMPKTGYESLLPVPCLVLFSCSFIAGAIFLMPDTIKTICTNRKTIFHRMISPETIRFAIKSTLYALCLSWIIFPLLTKIKITQYGLLSFLIVFLSGYAFRRLLKLFKSVFVYIATLTFGLILHIYFSPEFFAWPNWLVFPGIVLLYTFSGNIVTNTIKSLANSQSRIPFAPFLFLGCLLSYTPLIKWMLSAMH